MSRVDDGEALHRAYDESGTYLLHLQRAVEPHDLFVRCIGFGPQTRLVRYDPSAPLHDRYTMDDGNVPDDQRRTIVDTTLTINSFFGWEFNSCEALRQDGTWQPIDFANACPDSQVTSLHYHFPWLVTANLRWSIFCAATKRPMRDHLDWAPYFEIADSDAPYDEKLAAYAAIAHERFQTDEFEAFCANHLAHLDEVVREFFATDVANDAVRQKVAALFPAHEIDQFTELFWERIQRWRAEARRLTASDVEDRPPRWYSPRVEREVTVVRWGTIGTPVLVFPTAGGDAEEIERFQLVDACARADRRRPGQAVLRRQRQRAGAARRRGRRRPPGVDPAPVLRVHPPRGGAGDPHRLPVRRHRADRRRFVDRRLQRAGLRVLASPTCSRRRSA